MPRVALPAFDDDGTLLRWLRREHLPGHFPFTAGVFPFTRDDEEPTRMFAGEGDAFRTNRRFHLLSEGQPATRLSTAFDSVTLYGRDPDERPDIYGKVGTSGVSIATLDDMKALYAGFDLTSPTTSVSMTINGPAPTILAFFLNTAIDAEVEAFRIAGCREPSEAEPWVPYMVCYHQAMRAALFVKARLVRVSEPELDSARAAELARLASEHAGILVTEAFVHAVLAPPDGRLNRVVFEHLSQLFGAPSEDIWQTLFPARRRGRWLARSGHRSAKPCCRQRAQRTACRDRDRNPSLRSPLLSHLERGRLDLRQSLQCLHSVPVASLERSPRRVLSHAHQSGDDEPVLPSSIVAATSSRSHCQPGD